MKEPRLGEMPVGETGENPEKVKVEDLGETPIEKIDSTAIPVDIWLKEEMDEEGKPSGFWVLSSNIYMPRKGLSYDGVFKLRSRDPESLRQIIRDKIIPVYQAGISRLEAMINGTEDSLYYWDKPEESRQESQEDLSQ